MPLSKINTILGTILPYLRDRAVHSETFQVPASLSEMPLAAKREAAFALRRKAKAAQSARVGNPIIDGVSQGRAKQYMAVADFLEASIIDATGGLQTQQAPRYQDYPEDDDEWSEEDEAEYREWEEWKRQKRRDAPPFRRFNR